jgi:hypothetical protein
MTSEVRTRRREAPRKNGEAMPDHDGSEPGDFDFDDEFEPSLEEVAEVIAQNDLLTLAASVELRPADCLIFVLMRTCYETQQLAATMHLSGLFGVTEESVGAVILEFRRSTIERLFTAVGKRLACGPRLQEDMIKVWRCHRFLRGVARRDRTSAVLALFATHRIGDLARQMVVWMGSVAEEIAELTRDVRAIAGVSDLEASEMVCRIRKELRDANR